MFGYGLATIKCNKVWGEMRYQIWWKSSWISAKVRNRLSSVRTYKIKCKTFSTESHEKRIKHTEYFRKGTQDSTKLTKVKHFPTVTQPKLWPNCYEGSWGLFFTGFFQGQSADLPQDCWSERSLWRICQREAERFVWKSGLKLFVSRTGCCHVQMRKSTDHPKLFAGKWPYMKSRRGLYLLLSSSGKSITCWTSHATIRNLFDFLWEVQWEI